MNGNALVRLSYERKKWRMNHPFGFVAKPSKNTDGSLNLFEWDCLIPGKKATAWEYGMYRMKMVFTEDYPQRPPKCKFTPALFHPNIPSTGNICLPILDSSKDWTRTTSIRDILIAIQEFLAEPNLVHMANSEAYDLFKTNRVSYTVRIRNQARKHYNVLLH